MKPATLRTRCLIDILLSFFGPPILTVVTIAILGLTMNAAKAVNGQDDPGVQWLTGRDLDKFNELPISAWWSDAELRDRMIKFSSTQQIAVFLDRRIDPSTLVKLSVQNVTKEQFLWSVAEKTNLGICRVEDFYYFGPIESAANLPAVCDQLRKTTAQQHRRAKVDWSNRKPLKLSAIAQPKQLLLDLAEKNQFQIVNPEVIPHDLWAKFELPKTSLQVRVAILLVGFGKTFERNKDSTAITLIDIPKHQSTEATFAKLKNADTIAKSLRSKFPDLKIVTRGKRLVVSGAPVQVAAVQGLVVAMRKPKNFEGSTKTFTFTTRAQRGVVLATAAKGADLVLVFDESNAEIGKTLKEPIEVRAVNASADELLQQALFGTDLKYELVEGQVRVTQR